MSTVAWDGKSLAADRMGMFGDMRVLAPKLCALPNDYVGAIVGNDSAGRIMIEWFTAGADLKNYPPCQADNDTNATLIVARGEECRFYSLHPHAIDVRNRFMAWGSGRDFAMGAMAMGADARRAVQIASKFDAYTGMGVDGEML